MNHVCPWRTHVPLSYAIQTARQPEPAWGAIFYSVFTKKNLVLFSFFSGLAHSNESQEIQALSFLVTCNPSSLYLGRSILACFRPQTDISVWWKSSQFFCGMYFPSLWQTNVIPTCLTRAAASYSSEPTVQKLSIKLTWEGILGKRFTAL